MAIRPGSMFARRSAGRIEEALLREQDEWMLGMLPLPDLTFGLRNLRQRSAQVNGASLTARLRLPRDRPIKGKVDFKRARAVTIAPQMPVIRPRKMSAGNEQELLRSDIAEHSARRWQFVNGLDLDAGDNFASQHTQVRRQRLHNLLRATTRQRPANYMGRYAKQEAKAALGGRSSGNIECALRPASSARACIPLK